MKKDKLPYIHKYRDRHGRVRRYYRRNGVRIALEGEPGSADFIESYRHAVREYERDPKPTGGSRPAAGTINALAVMYYESVGFLNLRASTKRTYSGEIERLRAEHGDKRFAKLERRHVRKMVADKLKEGKPDAANNRLRVLRLLMQCAVDMDLMPDNPTIGIKKVRTKTEGYHTWTEAEIIQFEERWPAGTKEHLAFALLLYTGQRRSDMVRMGRQHRHDEAIDVRQEKTGKLLTIPLHPRLKAVLDDLPLDNLTYLVTSFGKPFSGPGFGNWFRVRCNKAGLPQCSAHGLRKAAATNLADVGCSALEIRAITGHESLAELEKYVKAANQKRLARSAMNRLSETEDERKLATLSEVSQKLPDNSLKNKAAK